MRDLLTSVAVFVLANTETAFRPSKIHEYHYFENRIKAIHDTWGSQIEHLFYVVGTNKYDYDFLHDHSNNCHLVPEESRSDHMTKVDASSVIRTGIDSSTSMTAGLDSHRRLAAHTPQIKSVNRFERYQCVIAPEASKLRYKKLMRANLTDNTPSEYITPNPEPFQFLVTGNCTGEYYGYGPTCRCQESMRYYFQSRKLRNVQWYLFLDDDVYIRPVVLNSFLSTFLSRYQAESKTGKGVGAGAGAAAAVALVAPRSANLKLDTSRKKKELLDSKSVCLSTTISYSYAQPAIISRDAVELLLDGVAVAPSEHISDKVARHRGRDRGHTSSGYRGEQAEVNTDISTITNTMTALQYYWGGSHDYLLGFSLYLRNIPVFSFGQYYHDGSLYKDEVYQYPQPPDPNNPSHHPVAHTVPLKHQHQHQHVAGGLGESSGGTSGTKARINAERYFIVHKVRDFPSETRSMVAGATNVNSHSSMKRTAVGETGQELSHRKKEKIAHAHVVRRMVSQYDIQAMFGDVPHQAFHISSTHSEHGVATGIEQGQGPGPSPSLGGDYMRQQQLVQEQREFEELQREFYDSQVRLGERFANELLDSADSMGFDRIPGRSSGYPRNAIFCTSYGRNNSAMMYPFYFRNKNAARNGDASAAVLPLFTEPDCSMAEGVELISASSPLKQAQFQDLSLECRP